MIFLGRQQLQVLLAGNLDVDAQTVGVEAGFVHQLAAGAGDALQVDVAVEAVHQAQIFGHAHQALHRVVGIAHHAAAQEEALDVIAAVELDGQVHQLADRQRGARQIVAAAVDAVGTVVDAIVGQHHLQQGDAAPVLGKAVADAHAAYGVAQHAGAVGAHRSAARTGDVVLGRLGQYLQFIQYIFVHNHSPESLTIGRTKIQKSLHPDAQKAYF